MTFELLTFVSMKFAPKIAVLHKKRFLSELYISGVTLTFKAPVLYFKMQFKAHVAFLLHFKVIAALFI